MPLLQRFLSFANDRISRSPPFGTEGPRSTKNGQRLKKFLTPNASGKPKPVEVDEEFRQSITDACFNTRLCPQCEALRVDERLAEFLQSPEDEAVTWADFSKYLPTIDESCDFCQFWKTLRQHADAAGNFRCFEVQLLNKQNCLIQKSWNLILQKWGIVSGFDELRMKQEGSCPGLQCPEKWPIDPFGVDYEELRNKLAFCDGRNRTHFRPKISPPPHPVTVINCLTRKLEPLEPGVKYVALSYCWGPPKPSSGDEPGHPHIPNYTEKTVEDAITVTSNLNYQYIWVDKYCINQKDGEEKWAQIKQMDYIYAQADLTIIAAAGDHADFGLPGVSTRPRLTRRSFKLGNYVLSPNWGPVRLMDALKQSKWMERGWTYQEALLSRRRLFFTDYCYLHDCGMCNIEGNESLSFESWKQCPTFVNHGRMKAQSLWMPYNHFEQLPDVYDRIKEYSKRSLSYQSDSLNAIMGVLHTFELSNPPIYHYHGVPILPPDRAPPDFNPDTTSMDGFVQSLRWCLNLSEVKKRRPAFPSWSWVGWDNQCVKLTTSSTVFEPTAVVVEIEDSSGERIDWARFEERGYLKDVEPSELPHCIWLEAETFVLASLDAPPPFEEDAQVAELVRNMPIEVSRFKSCVELFCKHDVEEMERLRAKCEAGKVVAVVLSGVSKAVATRSIIIVEEQDGVYRRVGNFDDNDFAMLFDIGPRFWERGAVELIRRWIRLS